MVQEVAHYNFSSYCFNDLYHLSKLNTNQKDVHSYYLEMILIYFKKNSIPCLEYQVLFILLNHMTKCRTLQRDVF